MKTDNELIAEFMGVKPETEYLVTHYAYDKHFNGWISESSYDDVKHLNTTGLEDTRIKQNPYDTDWRWLMPVVEKINTLEDSHGKLYCQDGLRISLPMGDLKLSYQYVTEFIKWYNNGKI